MTSTFDICIAGGGPAGSATAIALARLGYRVVLLERRVFPRPHVGESLPPSVTASLAELGCLEQVEQGGFLRPDRTRILWGDDDLDVASETRGFQVDRQVFDQLLLDSARAAGVTVRMGTSSSPASTAARFFVDARGRRSGPRRTTIPLFALWGYWRGHGLAGAQTRIESSHAEWFWGAPLPNGLTNATVFLDRERAGELIRRHGLDATYTQMLARSRLLAPCLDGELERVGACDASSSHALHPVTRSTIRVGEAAFCVDPMSSQGVQSALTCGLQASRVINTILRRPARTHAAIAFYQRSMATQVDLFTRHAGEQYARIASVRRSRFWSSRALVAPIVRASPVKGGEALLRISPGVSLTVAPVLVGDFVDMMPVLVHPNLRVPVFELLGVRVADVLVYFRSCKRPDRMLGGLATPERGDAIVRWFIERGILEWSHRT